MQQIPDEPHVPHGQRVQQPVLFPELVQLLRRRIGLLEERQVRYVLAIPKNEVLPLPDGRTQEARQPWARVPETLMERRSCADGAKGSRAYDFAVVDLAPAS